MLITTEQHVGLHIVDGFVKKFQGMGLEVYIMRKKRPFIIAAFGNGAERIAKEFGIKSIEKNNDFFRLHRDEFEEARSYLCMA